MIIIIYVYMIQVYSNGRFSQSSVKGRNAPYQISPKLTYNVSLLTDEYQGYI